MNEALAPKRFVEPHKVVSHFHLREGDTVADFGAGSGYFLKVLSQAVGETGQVYACEIQKNLVDTLGVVAQKEQLENIVPLWCDVEAAGGSKLEADSIKVGILVNTLFQMTDKEAAMSEVFRVLQSGGKLYIIDWTESFAGLGPQPDHVIVEAAARALAETAGFVYETSFDAADHHYGLVFRKP